MGENVRGAGKGEQDNRTNRTYPLYIFPGGLNSHPLLKKQYLPIATATELVPPLPFSPLFVSAEEG